MSLEIEEGFKRKEAGKRGEFWFFFEMDFRGVFPS